MNREELYEHLDDISAAEQRHLSSDTIQLSGFYTSLDAQGLREESGIYHLTRKSLKNPIKTGEPDSFWGRLEYSPMQKLFLIKKATRFYREPFMYADFIAVRYVYRGHCSIFSPESSLLLSENDTLLLNQGFVFSQKLEKTEDIVFTFMFDRDYISSNILSSLHNHSVVTKILFDYAMDSKPAQKYILFHGADNQKIREAVENILCEFMDPREYSETIIEYHLKIFLLELLHCTYEYKKTPVSLPVEKIAGLMNYVDENYRTVSLRQLSEEYGYSEKYISRLFLRCSGFNLKDYCFAKKLEEVCARLRDTDASILEILEQAGITSETYFYRKFRSQFGMSPAEYRKQTRLTQCCKF